MSQETVYSILFTLWQRHEDAARYYQKLQDMITQERHLAWLEDMVDHRRALGKALRDFLEQTAPIPVRNKSREETTSLLHRSWNKVEDAARREQWLQIIRLCRQNEEALSRYYQKSLGSEGIPEGIRDLLDTQHKNILEVNRKMERMETVPQQRKKP